MSRIRVCWIVVLALFVVVTAAYAGGWAIVTVKDVPDYAVASKPFTLAFEVRQHGITLLNALEPTITATNSNRQTMKFSPKATGAPGEYSAEVKLNEPGQWNIEIQSGFLRYLLKNATEEPKTPQAGYEALPLQVVAAGAPAPVLSKKQRGQRLYVAKGCNGCHESGIGPKLTGKPLSAGFREVRLGRPCGDV